MHLLVVVGFLLGCRGLLTWLAVRQAGQLAGTLEQANLASSWLYGTAEVTGEQRHHRISARFFASFWPVSILTVTTAQAGAVVLLRVSPLRRLLLRWRLIRGTLEDGYITSTRAFDKVEAGVGDYLTGELTGLLGKWPEVTRLDLSNYILKLTSRNFHLIVGRRRIQKLIDASTDVAARIELS